MPNFKKEMRKNEVFEHFLPCRLLKEPVNRRFLRLFAAKIHKSDRLLGKFRIFFQEYFGEIFVVFRGAEPGEISGFP